MPTYQYECAACGHTFELFQSMTDKKLRKCPKCGKMRLSRLIGSGSSIIFKGSGFYETDYKNTGSSKVGGSSNNKKKTQAASTNTCSDCCCACSSGE